MVKMYTCPYCGREDNYPLNNHSCWQSNPKAIEAENYIERKIREENS